MVKIRDVSNRLELINPVKYCHPTKSIKILQGYTTAHNDYICKLKKFKLLNQVKENIYNLRKSKRMLGGGGGEARTIVMYLKTSQKWNAKKTIIEKKNINI